MPASPSVDESLERLRRAVWSVGDTRTALLWIVSGSNGENTTYATAPTRAEAWWLAYQQSRAVGMLADVRVEEGRRRGLFP